MPTKSSRRVCQKGGRSLQPPLHLQKLRVAVYCRVSTKHKEQFNSLSNQKEYYQELVRKNHNWRLVGIFADTQSARSIKHRPGLNKLLLFCRRHKIDLILVKSVKRLARNTLDFLLICRELQSLGIETYFELERLYLSNPNAIMLLTIFAGLAQDESENLSQNTRWGIKRAFEAGAVEYTRRPCYGYTKGIEQELIIVPVEAMVVRRIFRWRMEGCSLREITARLAEQTVPSPQHRSRWSKEAISKILCNEKYTGNVLLQKTYVDNFLNGKQRWNKGERSRYLVSHTRSDYRPHDLSGHQPRIGGAV